MSENTEKNSVKLYIAIPGIILFLSLLILPTIAWRILMFAGKSNPAILESLTFDSNENRQPAELPETLDLGTLTGDLEAYYNDRVPFRSALLYRSKKINNSLDDLYADHIQPLFLSWINKNGTNYLPPRVINDAVIIGKDNWLFFMGDDSLEYYLGSNLMSDGKMEGTLQLMKRLQKLCDQKDIRLLFLFLPNKEQVYSEYMPSYTLSHTYKRVPRYVDYIRENSTVNITYLYDELAAGKDFCQMYFFYDTHWTRAGAFVGTQAMYRALGLPTTDIETVDMYTVISETGDLLDLAGYDRSEKQEDEFILDYHKNVELTFSEGDRAFEEPLRTEAAAALNDCHLVLLGDSFRLSMVPYLERDFTKCTFAHILHLDDSSIYPDILDADILVVEMVERNDVALDDVLQTLIGLYGSNP